MFLYPTEDNLTRWLPRQNHLIVEVLKSSRSLRIDFSDVRAGSLFWGVGGFYGVLASGSGGEQQPCMGVQ